MNDEVQVLVGAKVNFVRLGSQIDLNLVYGSSHNYKSVNIQIEVPFSLKIQGETDKINVEDLKSLPPMIQLLRTSVTNIKLTEKFELSISFSNGMELSVSPVEKYEAWHMGGGDVPLIVAQGI